MQRRTSWRYGLPVLIGAGVFISTGPLGCGSSSDDPAEMPAGNAGTPAQPGSGGALAAGRGGASQGGGATAGSSGNLANGGGTVNGGGTSGGGVPTSGGSPGAGSPGAGGGAGGDMDASGTAGSGGAGGAGEPRRPVDFEGCGNLGIAGVHAVSYLPNGSGVILAMEGAVAKLVDPVDASELRTFEGHTGAVNDVAISADGTLLVTASSDHSVKLFQISNAELLHTFHAGDSALLSVAVSADARRIAAGAADGGLYLWDGLEPKPLAIAKTHVNEVLGLGFAAADQRLFSASKDGSVRIWSATDLAPLGAAKQNGTWMTSLAVAADGTRVAVGEVMGNLSFYRASDGGFERSVQLDPWRVWNLDFSPNGQEVYASQGETIRAVPVSSGTPRLVLAPIGGTSIVAASPTTGNLFVATSWALWYTNSQGTSLRPEVQQGPFVRGIAFNPKGDRLAVGGEFGLVLRDVVDGSIASAPEHSQFASIFEAVAFSPDGTRLVSAEGDGLVHLWSTANWQSVQEIDTFANRGLESAAFSPDGVLFAVAGSDGVNEVYDAASATLIRGLGLIGQDCHNAIFSQQGNFAAASSAGGNLEILQRNGWSTVLDIQDAHDGTTDIAFSPDGRALYSTGDHRVSRWQTSGSAERHDVLNEPAFVGLTIDVSPGGDVLVAGEQAGSVRVWSLHEPPPDGSMGGAGGESGAAGAGGAAGASTPALPIPRVEASISSHGSSVVATRFSPDGRRLAVAYADSTVRLWCRLP